MQAVEKAPTWPASTSRCQDADRVAMRLELGRKMVEASKRMETDPEYRRRMQNMTR